MLPVGLYSLKFSVFWELQTSDLSRFLVGSVSACTVYDFTTFYLLYRCHYDVDLCNCYVIISGSSVSPLHSLGVQAQVPKTINVLIFKLRDPTPCQFDSICLSSVPDTDKKTVFTLYHSTVCS